MLFYQVMQSAVTMWAPVKSVVFVPLGFIAVPIACPHVPADPKAAPPTASCVVFPCLCDGAWQQDPSNVRGRVLEHMFSVAEKRKGAGPFGEMSACAEAFRQHVARISTAK
jgi:hypothetical protein